MSGEQKEINRELIRYCVKGDRRAQYRLYKLYSKAMYNICIRMLGSRDDAEDVLQDAFVKAFLKLGTYREDASFGSWLKMIVINQCLDFLKKRKLKFVDADEESFPDLAEKPAAEMIIGLEAVHESIKRLPGGARIVVNLYLLEGFSHKETAKMLNISESTAKTQYHRAKILLREMLKDKVTDEKY